MGRFVPEAGGDLTFQRKAGSNRPFSMERVLLYVLFVSYFVYQLQGTFFASGGILSQGLLFIIILIDLSFFVRSVLLGGHCGFYYLWTGFFLLNVIGFFFWGGDLSNQYHFSMLKGIVLCIGTFYPTYHMARSGKLRDRDLLVFFVLQLIASVVSFYHNATLIRIQTDAEDDLVNNVAYAFAFLIPYLFLVKKDGWAYAGLILLFAFIIQGAKRGAIIVGAVMLLIYIGYSLFTKRGEKGAIKRLFLVLIVMGGLGYGVYWLTVSNDFLAARFESLLEGNSSGRDHIYTAILNGWWDNVNDWSSMLFGFGFAGSQRFTGGLFAHNDWLEMLSNFGLVGVSLYFSLIVTGFAYALRRNSQWSIDDMMLLFAVMVAWFLTSLFSMWYTALGVLTQSLLIGYLMGKNTRTDY